MKKLENLEDPEIITDYDTVYPPSDDTWLILDYFREYITLDKFDGIDISKIRNLLDIGTGTGIIAIFFEMVKSVIKKFNPKIYASDILKESIECAQKNEKLNDINKKIEFIQSDLFDSFPEKLRHLFDIIIFNPPYLPSSNLIKDDETKKAIDFSWDGGKEGYEIFLKFLEKAKDYLKPNSIGYIYFISSSRTNIRALKKSIKQNGFSITILKKLRWFHELIFLNRIQPVRIE